MDGLEFIGIGWLILLALLPLLPWFLPLSNDQNVLSWSTRIVDIVSSLGEWGLIDVTAPVGVQVPRA